MDNDKVYFGDFDSKECVAGSFQVELPENINILIATYDTEMYEGYAFVMFELEGKYFEVSGSHCSCYGLEGQWEPDEVLFKELKNRAEKGNLYGRGDGNYAEAMKSILKEFAK